jgi:protein subunit release factor B
MSRFGVSPEKERALAARLQALGIREEDLEETFIRASGPGGQRVNKASTCVRLVHRPTGIAVKMQQARSQGLNRFLARRLLADRLEAQRRGHAAQTPQRDKIRRQKQRRARRAKRKQDQRAAGASTGPSHDLHQPPDDGLGLRHPPPER